MTSAPLKLPGSALNAICPYFTMYPLDFPYGIIKRHAQPGDWVLDPFCGRGTTNFAARLCGLGTVGIDSSPIAVAIAKAKLPTVSVTRIIAATKRILSRRRTHDVPIAEFWDWAFHPKTLHDICKLREAFMENCRSATRIVLRAISLGALHGPRNKYSASYFSNQSPRTFAPKPAYSVRYWKKKRLIPREVNVLNVIWKRALWYLSQQAPTVLGEIRCSDSRRPYSLETNNPFSFVITSPPYYGMRTYNPDQWLRNWFIGGSSEVDYAQSSKQIAHGSPNEYISQLRDVWKNAAHSSKIDARLICRFGGIRDRSAMPIDLIRESFNDSGWRIVTIRNAGTALDGKRQAHQFAQNHNKPRQEYDVYARRL